jgi:Dimerisation domain of Ca+-activated chloride-channel, anoctamin
LFRFLGSDNPETFFPTRDRQRVAYEILAKTVYGKKKRAEVGIDRLVEEEVYSAAFPLHDVSTNHVTLLLPDAELAEVRSDRPLLTAN